MPSGLLPAEESNTRCAIVPKEKNPACGARGHQTPGIRPGSLVSRASKASAPTDGVSMGRRILDRLDTALGRRDALLRPRGRRAQGQTPSRVMHRVTVRNIEIAHKGLLAFFARGDARRIPASLAPRIRRILSDLDAAVQPRDMNLPGYRLHRLSGDRRGQWSVRVSGNWRIVFRFENGEPVDVTLVDYH